MLAPRISLPLLLALLALTPAFIESKTIYDPSLIQSKTIYDILNAYGLPSGILPDSVTSYTAGWTRSGIGVLDINLKRQCTVRYFDYLARFDSKITGKLKDIGGDYSKNREGTIYDLKGVQVLLSGFWVDIDRISTNYDRRTLTFFFVENVDRTKFETIPTCKDKLQQLAAGSNHSSSNVNSTSALIKSNDDDIYALLNSYGLPSGILPDSVTSYTKDPIHNVGYSLVINLKKPCYFTYDYYPYYFHSKITGDLFEGYILNLNGIQVKRSYLWLDIDEIKVKHNGGIELTVTRKFDRQQFERIPTCRYEAQLDADNCNDHSTSNLTNSKQLQINEEEVDRMMVMHE